MRSDAMISNSGWMMRILRVVGILAVLQGVLMLFGVPELLLPLRVRVGRS